MVEHKTVSMQESTTGAVSQFLDYEGCECLQSIKLLAFLSGALQRYEEEGVVLNPKLVLCNSIADFAKALPGGKFIVIGEDSYSGESGKKILKQCANLAAAGWVIFVERREDGSNVKFGVLSFLESPTSLDLREMVSLSAQPGFVVVIEKIDPKTVLMTGARGNTLRIAFSTTRTADEEGLALQKFSIACTSNTTTDGFSVYFRNLLNKSLNMSHGSILVCRQANDINKVRGMNDAVKITPPLNLHAAFNSYRTINSSESILELQRSEALLVGMMQSDGIVVFDEEGQVTAYRVFYKEVAKKRGEKDAKTTPVGGARRRAFEGVKSLVGSELKCALFRSQDGLTVYQGAQNAQ